MPGVAAGGSNLITGLNPVFVISHGTAGHGIQNYTMYRELAAMERAGLIEAGERGARERKPYTLTEDGRQAFAEWIERDPGPENIRYPMLLTVAFGAHLAPERLAAMLDSHRAAHERQLAEYERDAAAHGSNRFALATLDFGIVYERAVLEWFDRVGNRLGQGQTGL